MDRVSYAYEMSELSLAYINNDYSDLKKTILNDKMPVTYSITYNDEIFGYHLHKNKPVSPNFADER